jgi:hypothetical protein
VKSLPRIPLAVALGMAGLLALYWGCLHVGFLNDDFLFLEEAKARPLGAALARLGALANYYRPLSRQVYFAALTKLSGDSPGLFHAVNFTLFALALALLADLLAATLPPLAVGAGLLYFALLPLQRVTLLWISCAQDLLALVGSLAALALHRRGRTRWAACATFAALASKDVALALPFGLAAWDAIVLGMRGGKLARRLVPQAAALAAWGAVLAIVHVRAGLDYAFLRFAPTQFAAALVHGAQSLLGLDHPSGAFTGLAAIGPAPLALGLLGAAVLALPAPEAGAPRPRVEAVDARRLASFALVWFVAFSLVTAPVAHTWSSYYYGVAAVGGALVVALAARRLQRGGALALVAGLLWWHAGMTGSRAFAVRDDPWGWTSHLTSFYFERGASLSTQLARDLRRIEPHPPAGTRFFFATLPPWAGFQMGNGALIRTLYRDASLESHFYSEYSDSIAANRPCRFLYWDGTSFAALYPRIERAWFQVGGDLLLLDRPRGARDAFRRGLVEGGERADLLYWLGWAELWNGDRGQAEAAWRAFGAADDSSAWAAHLAGADRALAGRDSIGARRELMAAVGAGIGRPRTHTRLGELLWRSRGAPALRKYALLELTVGVWLEPDDAAARRALALGLGEARLDAGAARQLAALAALDPGWRRDAELRALAGRLGEGAPEAVARFE